jgi:hypothetical protein
LKDGRRLEEEPGTKKELGTEERLGLDGATASEVALVSEEGLARLDAKPGPDAEEEPSVRRRSRSGRTGSEIPSLLWCQILSDGFVYYIKTHPSATSSTSSCSGLLL